ncbi:PREDICTED: protein NATD1 isoform X2 [Hipposideros armiger]|uniref:Protein NATD1 isoform X2 n=1 Tax=Hipposideros armiger TaxID=186990 RepID=A0A8B7SHZ4_HIPAR|nr:PREDICTED: protein NATD1 isoform X2 [Hipposideros armiger]
MAHAAAAVPLGALEQGSPIRVEHDRRRRQFTVRLNGNADVMTGPSCSMSTWESGSWTCSTRRSLTPTADVASPSTSPRLSSNSLQAGTSLCSRHPICLVSTKYPLESREFEGMEWEQRLPPRGPGGRLPPFGDLKAQRQLSKVGPAAFTEGEGEAEWQGWTLQQPARLGSCATAA